ncbi:hypothetical protein LINGRAHAP2_LOCUS29684 [Linum grandiflorum]
MTALPVVVLPPMRMLWLLILSFREQYSQVGSCSFVAFSCVLIVIQILCWLLCLYNLLFFFIPFIDSSV